MAIAAVSISPIGAGVSVSAYVGSLRGSSPPNPKKPQGDLLPYDPTAALAEPTAEAEADEPQTDEVGG